VIDQPVGRRIRAGDEDRRRATDALSAHHADGRLEFEEFSERMEAASTARYLDELPPLFADLPGTAAPVVASGQPPARSWHRSGPPSLVVLRPVLVVLSALAVIGAVVSGHPPVLPFVLLFWWLLAHRGRRLHSGAWRH